MSTDCGSFGIATKVGYVASNAIDGAFKAATTQMEILGENLQYSDQIIGGMGITGSINQVTNHLRQGQRMVSGGLVTEIGPVQLAPWIRALCGNTAANETKDSWDAVPFDFTIKRDKVTHGYRYCVIQSAVIRCRSVDLGAEGEQQIMQMALNFFGVEENAAATWPSITLPAAASLFWIMADSNLAVGSDDFDILGFDLTIRNRIQPLFRNQMNPGCFRCLGRDITLEVQVPYSTGSATALFGDNDTNLEVALELASSNMPTAFAAYATTITLPTCRRVEKAASTRGKGEIPLVATFRSYEDDGDPTMTITNVTSA